jgi:hypothetical protein
MNSTNRLRNRRASWLSRGAMLLVLWCPRLDEAKILNEGVYRLLRRRSGGKRRGPSVHPPGDAHHDYLQAGSHPEIVERLWDQLGKNLPRGSRALVFGTPALVHPGSGVVIAFALGTEYAMRLPRSVRSERRHAGLRTVARWSGGSSTDVARECGPEWIFGSFANDEMAWCEAAYRECEIEVLD